MSYKEYQPELTHDEQIALQVLHKEMQGGMLRRRSKSPHRRSKSPHKRAKSPHRRAKSPHGRSLLGGARKAPMHLLKKVYDLERAIEKHVY